MAKGRTVAVIGGGMARLAAVVVLSTVSGMHTCGSLLAERDAAPKMAQAIEGLKGMHEIDIAVRRIVSPKEFENDLHLYAGALYGLAPLGGGGIDRRCSARLERIVECRAGEPALAATRLDATYHSYPQSSNPGGE